MSLAEAVPVDPEGIAARSILQRPPRWIFHGAASILGVALLASRSTPGGNFFLMLAAMFLSLGAAIVWFVRAVIFGVHRVGRTSDGSAWWFVVAPVAAMLVLVLLLGDVPLRARWAASEHWFNEVVAHERYGFSGSRRIGLYTITHVSKVKDGVLFYEQTGALFDDAGFAYLPHGPYTGLANGSFENPQFVHLHGPWYAWTASW